MKFIIDLWCQRMSHIGTRIFGWNLAIRGVKRGRIDEKINGFILDSWIIERMSPRISNSYFGYSFLLKSNFKCQQDPRVVCSLIYYTVFPSSCLSLNTGVIKQAQSRFEWIRLIANLSQFAPFLFDSLNLLNIRQIVERINLDYRQLKKSARFLIFALFLVH